jgi:hypothetical protein
MQFDRDRAFAMGWKLGAVIIGLGVLYGASQGILYGASQGLRTNNLPLHLFAGSLTGVIVAGVVWLIVSCANALRIENPSLIVTRIGTVLYWIGCVFSAYFLLAAIFIVREIHSTSDELPGAPAALGYAIGSAFLCWFLGRGIRYMLGR